MRILTAEEMRAAERGAVERGIALESLMAVAGNRVADAARETATDGPILALIGPGNNGGDGLIAAESLRAGGRDVTVYSFHRDNVSPYGGSVVIAESDVGREQLARLAGMSRVILDGLLGIGQNRPVAGTLAAIVETVNRRKGRETTSISIDIPTGVHTDTGSILGRAFESDITVCMGFLKPGLVLYPGAGYAGTVEVADVGIPLDLAPSTSAWFPQAPDIARLLPERPYESNKGTFGRVVYVGGSRDFLGAPVLCSMAAYRAGAGLVEVAVTQRVQQAVAGHLLEPIYAVLPEEGGRISPGAVPQLSTILLRADALVFGPGMGLSDETIQLTAEVLRALPQLHLRGAVLDADALNALARLPSWWETAADIVLTPHPGEMSRLTGESIDTIQSDRIGTARRYARTWQKVVVLKGARTVVASPGGGVTVIPTGGPNLATGGTGDVLSGIIGGLMAQGCRPEDAAVAGAFLHGYAGDLLRQTLGDAGTVAGDLLAEIPRARVAIQRGAQERT